MTIKIAGKLTKIDIRRIIENMEEANIAPFLFQSNP
jgi:hypothetical protein